MLLTAATSHLVVVDMQTRLLPAMSDAPSVLRQVGILTRAAARLQVPVTISEHCADKIGPTAPDILAGAEGASVLAKTTFSCLGEDRIAARLAAMAGDGRRQMVVAGIEAHVCVLQTALAARIAGHDVFVVTDAVMSRRVDSHAIAVTRMVQAGIVPVTTEMVLFEWLGRAGTDDFKALSPLIR